jgi:putative salt-induced outer membrane protein YdiY
MLECKKKIRGVLFLTIVFLSAAIAGARDAQADQIIFANGDRISGQIIHISEVEIQIATEYAGQICADFPQVVDMNTDIPGKIMLRNDDIITGRIQSLSEEIVVIESQGLGTLQLSRDRFAGFITTDQTDESTSQSGGQVDVVEAPEGESKQDQKAIGKKETAEDTPAPDYWSGSFAVGAQLQRGNTDTTDVHTDIKATRKAEREELTFRFYSSYGETEGETDKNEVFGQVKLKLLKTDRFYLFGTTDMEYDEMEQLDLRAQGFGGLGYKLIARERTTLLAEAGAGLTGEFFDAEGDEENLEASAILNAELTQKLFEQVVFYQGITLYPSLGDVGEFRVRSESSLRSPLGGGWAIKLSLIDDYDSDPENEDVKENDVRFISAIEYTF